jgi:hypothetical protein
MTSRQDLQPVFASVQHGADAQLKPLDPAATASRSVARVLSLGELLQHNPNTPPCLIEPRLLPAGGILFIGGEPSYGANPVMWSCGSNSHLQRGLELKNST